MRIFEPLQEIEWRDGDRLVGVYTPGTRYTCTDSEADTALAGMLEQWLDEGLVKIVEESNGTAPANVTGRGETK
jgi:hypothetical protein